MTDGANGSRAFSPPSFPSTNAKVSEQFVLKEYVKDMKSSPSSRGDTPSTSSHEDGNLLDNEEFLNSLLTCLLSTPYQVTQILLSVNYQGKEAIAVGKRKESRGDSESDDQGEEDEEEYEKEYKTWNLKKQPISERVEELTDENGYLLEDNSDDNLHNSSSNLSPNNRDRLVIRLGTDKSGKVIRPSLWESMKTISHYIGITGLFRGLFTSVFTEFLRILIDRALKFVLMQRRLNDYEGFDLLNPQKPESIISSFASDLLLHPLSVLRVRLVVQNVIRKERIYHGFRHGLRMIWNEQSTDSKAAGPSSFYRYFPYMSFYYLALRALEYISTEGPSSIVWLGSNLEWSWQKAVIISLASATCSLIAIPLKTIYYRLIIQPGNHKNGKKSTSGKGDIPVEPSLTLATCVPVSKRHYNGGLDCFLRVWREEGLHKLYPLWHLRIPASIISSFLSTVYFD